MQSTSHTLALSDRGPQGLFFPLGDDEDHDARKSSTNATLRRAHGAPGPARSLSCPNAFNPHRNPKIITAFNKFDNWGAEQLSDFPHVV